jgi:hypothetical protein
VSAGRRGHAGACTYNCYEAISLGTWVQTNQVSNVSETSRGGPHSRSSSVGGYMFGSCTRVVPSGRDVLLRK